MSVEQDKDGMWWIVGGFGRFGPYTTKRGARIGAAAARKRICETRAAAQEAPHGR